MDGHCGSGGLKATETQACGGQGSRQLCLSKVFLFFQAVGVTFKTPYEDSSTLDEAWSSGSHERTEHTAREPARQATQDNTFRQPENPDVNSETALSGNSSHTSARPRALELGWGGLHCLPGEQLGSLPRTVVRNVRSCRLTPAPTRVGAKRGREAAPGPEDTARPGRPGPFAGREADSPPGATCPGYVGGHAAPSPRCPGPGVHWGSSCSQSPWPFPSLKPLPLEVLPGGNNHPDLARWGN